MGWLKIGYVAKQHSWSAGADLHVRLIREANCFDRLAGQSVPVHGPRVRHGDQSLLLQGTILRSQHRTLSFRRPEGYWCDGRVVESLLLREEFDHSPIAPISFWSSERKRPMFG